MTTLTRFLDYRNHPWLALRRSLGLAISFLGLFVLFSHAHFSTLLVPQSPLHGALLMALATLSGSFLFSLFPKHQPQQLFSSIGFIFMGGCAVGALFIPSLLSIHENALLEPSGSFFATQTLFFMTPALHSFLIAFTLGLLMIVFLAYVLPHSEPAPERSLSLASPLLMIFALSLHNAPEGLALIGTPDLPSTVYALAIQNVPEGFLIALALSQLPLTLSVRLFWVFALAFIEPITTFLFITFADLTLLIPDWINAFCAGAMIALCGLLLRDVAKPLPLMALNFIGLGAVATLFLL